MIRSLVATSLTLLAATTVAEAQSATLTRTGGVLGGNVDYTLQGDPGEIWILLPSLQPGPTPLAVIDPGDPRVLGIGLDQVHLMQSGFLDGAGTASASFYVAADPALHGIPVYAQFVTWPGSVYRIDDVSNLTSFPFNMPGASAFTVGEMTKDVSGHTVTPLLDGRVLIAGGTKTVGLSTVVTNELEVFDPLTHTFTRLSETMSQVRTVHTATLLADGRVLLCGGANNLGVITNSVDIWDPVAGTVTAQTGMKEARTQHTASLLPDGRVFVAGGTSDFDFTDILGALSAISGTTEIFDPVAGTWTYRASLPKPRILHNASVIGDGRVLITGGIEVTVILGFPYADFSSDCRAYAAGSNAMQNVSNFSGVRAAHGQVSLANGDVLVAGGADGNLLSQTINPIANCRFYDWDQNSWSSVSSMAHARVYPNLIDVGGEVVAIGGLSTFDLANFSGTPVLPIEVTDLATGWTVEGAMLNARMLVLCAAIENGVRILSVGRDGVGNSAEVYAPQ